MASPYLARFEDTPGRARLDGEIVFTDPANQPGDGGNAAAIDGVTVTGIPAAGDIIIATAATTATWQTPATAPAPVFLPMTFDETVAGLVYTASIVLPANTRLLDVLCETFTGWTAATVSLDVGDSDGADALVQTLSMAAQIGVPAFTSGGTNWGNGLTHNDGPYSSTVGPGKLYSGGDTITAVITATVPGGPTGISRVTLIAQVEATAVAAVAAP